MYTFIESLQKKKALIEGLKQREQEVFGYQINIDNYRIALEIIPGTMTEFKKDLEARLKEELKQQSIAQLMLDVILKQLEDEDIEELICSTQS